MSLNIKLRRTGRMIIFACTGVIGMCVLAGAIFDMSLDDFRVPGTQVGDVIPQSYLPGNYCGYCHKTSEEDPASPAPFSTWQGSLMAMAGRDPLFFAQMATAEQDVTNVGYYCMRCHVPLSIASGHAEVSDGTALDEYDRDGVDCHFCHSMVDPIYKPGVSPAEDLEILKSVATLPQFPGNAMFVLDPSGTRRGTRQDSQTIHELLISPFHNSGEMCGTCHDVGNVAVSKQPNGTYRYNSIGEPCPDQNPAAQFPLERTYTEWKLSQYANGGVDAGGRFGGVGASVVATCQDCHMPRTSGQACIFTDSRPDLRQHEFAGAAVSVLAMIALNSADDPDVSPAALALGMERSRSMLARAATLDAQQQQGALRVRVTNESGHKLPTGHIEGRRMWVTARLLDASNNELAVYGGYDLNDATLDASSTKVYEMLVGLSDSASKLTGLPAGRTGHMSLADTVVKDNRIPPRGFANAAYEAGGAPVVMHSYADGQHWDDSWYTLLPGCSRVEVSLWYQNVPREYVEHLRESNHTNESGETLWNLWNATDRGAPVLMATTSVKIATFRRGDLNGDGKVDGADLGILLGSWGAEDSPANLIAPRVVDGMDLLELLANWG